MPLLDVETGLKVCSKCKESKPGTSFSKNSRKSDGLSGWCKDCYKKHRKYKKRILRRYES